jgi:hypothetical protein
MLDCESFAHDYDDGRGRYPDRISANTPKGLRETVRLVAGEQGLSLGEFVRRSLIDAIRDAQSPGGASRKDAGAAR